MPWTVLPSSLHDAEGGLVPCGAGVVQQRHETDALDLWGVGQLEAGELGDGAVDVERLDDACGGATVAARAGHVDDEAETRVPGLSKSEPAFDHLPFSPSW